MGGEARSDGRRAPVLRVTAGPPLDLASLSIARHSRQVVRSMSWWRVELPLVARLHHASVDTATLDAVIVRLDTDSGTGYAEVRSNGAYATHETADDIVAALRSGEWIDGSLADAVEELLGSSRLAAMAVDVAGWDALARSDGIPMYRLFSERGLESLPTHAPIGFGTVDEAGYLAGRRAAEGFRRLKLRMSTTTSAVSPPPASARGTTSS
jgi:L-alanine-DL-glutamate epimerase-like enolase superfamily enzyme